MQRFDVFGADFDDIAALDLDFEPLAALDQTRRSFFIYHQTVYRIGRFAHRYDLHELYPLFER